MLEKVCIKWLQNIAGQIEGVVAIDAMGCQKTITKAIADVRADYVLNLKSNHSHLHQQVAFWFQKICNQL